jgi:hypothetical protein
MLYSIFAAAFCAALERRACMLTRRLSCLALLMALASPAMAADTPSYGEKLEGFDYGWPVKHFTFTSQNQSLDMAYLDVKPEKPNGRTVVLMHGKNFCAGTWDGTIRALSASGLSRDRTRPDRFL